MSFQIYVFSGTFKVLYDLGLICFSDLSQKEGWPPSPNYVTDKL